MHALYLSIRRAIASPRHYVTFDRQALEMEWVLLVFASMDNGKDEADNLVIYEQGATEEQTEKIEAIVGREVLGYDGSGQGEHSGQDLARDEERLSDTLADNRPEQIK